jgi:phospholipid-binding lipoprotein MlaA
LLKTNDVVTDAIEYSSIPESDTPEHRARFQKLKEIKRFKNIKASDLKVNANAAQPDQVKDPLQPLIDNFCF